MSDESNIWTGIVIGAVVTFFIMYSISQSDLDSLREYYQSKNLDLSSEIVTAHACIDGLENMLSLARDDVSLASISATPLGEDYETLYDALQETEGHINSASSDMRGYYTECSP